MGCSSSTPAPIREAAADPPSSAVDSSAKGTAPAPLPVKAPPPEEEAATQQDKPRYPGFEKYPESLRVTFSFEEKDLIVSGGQEVGLRYARACQKLGESTCIEPAIFAEAYSDPRVEDRSGAEVVSLQALPESAWPVSFVFPKQKRRYNLLLGLPGSGKTSLLQALSKRTGQPMETRTSDGKPRLETLSLDDFTCFASWVPDQPAGAAEMSLLDEFRQDVLSVVFVVDASDPDRMDECRRVLAALLGENSPLPGVALLIYANKRDLEGGMPAADIVQRLELASLDQRRCYVQSCCALTGDGVFAGIGWLSQAIGGQSGARPAEQPSDEPAEKPEAQPAAQPGEQDGYLAEYASI